MLMGLDRPAAAEFSFFLAMPTMTAAFAHDLLKVRHQLSSERALEIAIGFVMAFIASLPGGQAVSGVVRRSGFAPFAWYRIVLGLAVIRGALPRIGCSPSMQWLRRSFIAGFFVTVPLVISVAAFVWIFRLIDGFVGPFYDAWLQRMPQLGITHAPGLGILTTALFVLLVGAFATNVIGKRLLQRDRRLPAARAGLPDDLRAGQAAGGGVLARQRVRVQAGRAGRGSARGFVLGFLTKEFTVDRGQGPEAMIAVYVPTNHLYLGDVDHLRARQGVVPGHHRRAGHSHIPDRRHGAGEPHQGPARRRSRRRFPRVISRHGDKNLRSTRLE